MRMKLALFGILGVGISSSIVAELGSGAKLDETRQITRADLPGLMAKHKPPYAGHGQPTDPAITFDRVDVIIEGGIFGPRQTPYLSIGRNGSYFYKTHTLQFPDGKNQVGANFVGRLRAKRITELQRLLKATDWLAAAGGEGPARHTDANDMVVALTRDGKIKTVIFQGGRPAPYADLQKFFYDLVWQEHMYYRLTRLPDDRKMALYEFHNAIESALGRSGRGKPEHYVDFDRYHELFAQTLERWYSGQTDELRAAIDLMVLLERKEHAEEIARLRNDRESNVRTTVARSLPALSGEKAIPWLVEMVKSTEEARIALIRLGQPAVPAIVEIIEKDESRESAPSVMLIRAYLDHWKELPQPIDAGVIDAVKANMELEIRRNDLQYQREFLKLAGEAERKPATLRETAELFFKHLKAGDEKTLSKIKDNVGSIEEWFKLRESFAPETELKIETLLIDKFHAFLQTRPFKDKSGNEIHIVVFINQVRGIDWRVGPALSESANRMSFKDQFLKNHAKAKPAEP
jgi:hypothetical protein